MTLEPMTLSQYHMLRRTAVALRLLANEASRALLPTRATALRLLAENAEDLSRMRDEPARDAFTDDEVALVDALLPTPGS